MLADHLAPDDYAITRTAFAVLVLMGVAIAAASVSAAKGWTRAIGLVVATLLAFAAVRVHFRWEQVTDAADLMKGDRPRPGQVFTRSGVQWSEVDDFGRAVLGGGVVMFTLWVLLVTLAASIIWDRRHPTEHPRQVSVARHRSGRA